MGLWRWIRLVAAIALVQTTAGQGQAQENCAGLLGNGRVLAVAAFGEIQLADGRKLRLAGLEPPYPDEPARINLHGQRLQAALTGLLEGAEISLFGSNQADRRGRLAVQVKTVDGIWAQRALIAQGLTRVMPVPGEQACAKDLLAAEALARDTRRGIWGDPVFAVRSARSPEALSSLTDSFQIIEGVVSTVSVGKSEVFLNFGENWRLDFTGKATAAMYRQAKAAGVDLAKLRGKQVRVRGFIERRNGPMITLQVPEQIELLD